MNLSELIDRLNQEYLHRKVPIGFGNPHSYRGSYAKLAFEPEIDSSVCNMLSACSHALGRDFEGYNGGTYRMDGYTECYLAQHGQCGIEIDDSLLDRILVQIGSVTTFKPIETGRIEDSGRSMRKLSLYFQAMNTDILDELKEIKRRVDKLITAFETLE